MRYPPCFKLVFFCKETSEVRGFKDDLSQTSQNLSRQVQVYWEFHRYVSCLIHMLQPEPFGVGSGGGRSLIQSAARLLKISSATFTDVIRSRKISKKSLITWDSWKKTFVIHQLALCLLHVWRHKVPRYLNREWCQDSGAHLKIKMSS